MALPTYPTDLPIPEAPFSGDLLLPLSASEVEGIGAYLTVRDRTRAPLEGSASLKLTSAQVTTFRTWQRDTLNKGLVWFYADWIAVLGYEGYIGRIPTFSIGTIGVEPLVQIDLELKPYIQYSQDEPTIPSPWPSLNA